MSASGLLAIVVYQEGSSPGVGMQTTVGDPLLNICMLRGKNGNL